MADILYFPWMADAHGWLRVWDWVTDIGFHNWNSAPWGAMETLFSIFSFFSLQDLHRQKKTFLYFKDNNLSANVKMVWKFDESLSNIVFFFRDLDDNGKITTTVASCMHFHCHWGHNLSDLQKLVLISVLLNDNRNGSCYICNPRPLHWPLLPRIILH